MAQPSFTADRSTVAHHLDRAVARTAQAQSVSRTGGEAHTVTTCQPTRLDEQLCFALYAATNTITRTYRPLLRQIGLTYPQYLVMLALWDHDGTPTRHVAHRLDLPANALSPLLDRLEHRGLVRRLPDEHDRRVHRVHLTDTGRSLQTAAAAQAAVADTTRLTQHELCVLRELLHRLYDAPEASTDSS